MFARSLALVLGAAAFAAPFPEPHNNQKVDTAVFDINGFMIQNVTIGQKLIFNRYTYTDGETDRIEFDDQEFQNCFCK
jgi:hypothetical protein